MTRGIFREMQADHLFRTLPSGATEMRDLFRIAAPIPILGLLAEKLFLRPSSSKTPSSPRNNLKDSVS